MTNIEYRKSISEVLEILKHTKKEDVQKISPKFLEFLKNNALNEYKPHLDHSKRIKEMGLNDKTIAILSIIASKYWISNDDREIFENQLKENEKKYQEELRKKYNPENIFKNEKITDMKNVKQENSENTSLIEYKEDKWYKKILTILKRIFNSNL